MSGSLTSYASYFNTLTQIIAVAGQHDVEFQNTQLSPTGGITQTGTSFILPIGTFLIMWNLYISTTSLNDQAIVRLFNTSTSSTYSPNGVVYLPVNNITTPISGQIITKLTTSQTIRLRIQFVNAGTDGAEGRISGSSISFVKIA